MEVHQSPDWRLETLVLYDKVTTHCKEAGYEANQNLEGDQNKILGHSSFSKSTGHSFKKEVDVLDESAPQGFDLKGKRPKSSESYVSINYNKLCI